VSIAWLERETHGRLSIITVLYDTVGSGNPMTCAASLRVQQARAPHSGWTDDRHERRSDDRHSLNSRNQGDSRTLEEAFELRAGGRSHRHHSTALGSVPNSTEVLAGSDSSPSRTCEDLLRDARGFRGEGHLCPPGRRLGTRSSRTSAL